jgi:cytochrome P450
VKNTARVMFQGGYSTMAAAVGNAVAVLLDRPDALERMRDAALLATGVDELVRFDGPVQGTTRVAVRACRIGGVDVAAGQKVVPERTPNRHLGYGWGPHACIGTTVAQAGLRALITALNEHPARLVAAGDGIRRRTATMRVYQTLPALLRL